MSNDPIDEELLRQQEEEQKQKQEYTVGGDGNGNGKEKRKTVHFVQKHSETGLLAEAVIIGGIPYFAVSRSDTRKITSEDSIPITGTSEYKPFEQTAYLSESYRFESIKDFESCIERARGETLDSLYRKEKSIWLKYIDADDFHISICAADTIFTYFQDKIGLTHYLFFVGSPGSGKSNNLLVLKYLAYRNFTSTDMTAANIYQFLGNGEEGQGTLCEDEADRMEEDRQKMGIYKNGYITGFPVARTDTSFGRNQLKYNTYCLKAFAAERFPDSFKAKGLNQRVLELQCSFGDPEYDIVEVVNPAGENEFQELLNELHETRNLLLAYRLLHFNERIPDIKLNIKGRERQLFKPVLRIFQNTKTLTELLPVVSRYVAQKREANFSTLYAFLYRAVRDMIKDQHTATLGSHLVWSYIKAGLQGEEIPGKALSCETPEFGVISQKEITQTLEHVFGSKIKKSHGIRKIAFDVSKLQRLGRVYDLAIEIKVVKDGDNSFENNRGADWTDWTDVEGSRYTNPSTKEPQNLMKDQIPEHESTPNNGPVDSPHPSNASNPTPPTSYSCYHCDDFHTNNQDYYENHMARKHS